MKEYLESMLANLAIHRIDDCIELLKSTRKHAIFPEQKHIMEDMLSIVEAIKADKVTNIELEYTLNQMTK